MSNVLIGIIGVILFIGLALAGALILGDDFRSASSSSKAAASIAQGRQIVNALSMHDLKTGTTFPYERSGVRTSPSDLVPRFLKTGTTTDGWHFHTKSGGGVHPAADLKMNETNAAVCLEVQRQSGQATGDATAPSMTRLSAAQIASMPMGCTLQSIGGEDHYVLFVTS